MIDFKEYYNKNKMLREQGEKLFTAEDRNAEKNKHRTRKVQKNLFQSIFGTLSTAAGNAAKSIVAGYQGLDGGIWGNDSNFHQAGMDTINDPEYKKLLKEFIKAVKDYSTEGGQTETNKTRLKNAGVAFYTKFKEIVTKLKDDKESSVDKQMGNQDKDMAQKLTGTNTKSGADVNAQSSVPEPAVATQTMSN